MAVASTELSRVACVRTAAAPATNPSPAQWSEGRLFEEGKGKSWAGHATNPDPNVKRKKYAPVNRTKQMM